MTKIVMEGKFEPKMEDNGQAMICEIDGPETTVVRVQSWDETGEHARLSELAGKTVRITIETI